MPLKWLRMAIFPSEFRIGPVRVAPATVLAPMAGVTDTVFRRLIRNQGGCGLLMTEFTSSHGVVNSFEGQETYSHVSLSVLRAGGASDFGAAVRLRSAGDGGRGARLRGFRIRRRRYQLRLPGEQSGQVQWRFGAAARPPLVEEILRKVRAAISIPLTMKFRAGWNDRSWSACGWRKLAEDCGLQAVALHPRTREQGYSGQADWTRIAESQSRGEPHHGNRQRRHRHAGRRRAHGRAKRAAMRS